MKQWLKTAVVCVASLLLLGAASGFIWVWNTEYMAAGSPGQWLSDTNGFLFRLDGVSLVSEIPGYGEAKTTALPGATFVGAEISVRAPEVAPSNGCTFRLVGAGRNLWWPSTSSTTTATGLCRDAIEAAAADSMAEVSGTIFFEVPDTYLDQIMGVAVMSPGLGLESTPMLVP